MEYILLVVLIGLLGLFLSEMYRQVTKLNTVRRLIDTYEHDTENPKVIDEMYAFCLMRQRAICGPDGARLSRFSDIRRHSRLRPSQ